MPPVRVVIAEGSDILRRALRKLLEGENDLTVVADVADIRTTRKVVVKFRPHILLLGETLVETRDTILKIHKTCRGTKILLLAKRLSHATLLGYLAAGVRGVVIARDTERELAQAVRTLRKGEIWASRKLIGDDVEQPMARVPSIELRNRPHGNALTPAERRIAHLAAQGLRNREIAEQIGLSEKTVKNHLTKAFQKLGCRNRTELAYLVAAATSVRQ